MQVFITAALLLLLGTNDASAQGSVQDLSPLALADLQTELLTWKLSAAGGIAKKNGFTPGSSTGMSIMVSDGLQDQELQRLLNAKREIERIQKSQPHASFSLETPFALMTPEEFAAYTRRGLGPLPDLKDTSAITAPAVNRSLQSETDKRVLASLPTTVDWESYGCVTPVKNQGACGSCSGFASVAAVESAYCIRSGGAKTLIDLSEQDMTSCGPYQANCQQGQYIQTALDWMPRLNGGSICTTQSYPFQIVDTKSPTCLRYEYESVSCTKPDMGIVGYNGQLKVPNNSVAMMQNVALRPVVVEINALFLQYYRSGVLLGDEASCPADKINHAVLITGYGEEAGAKYWRFKNSWSTVWGDKGYFKIERGYTGHPLGACGIERSYHYPVFASEAPYLASRRSSAFKKNVEFSGTLLDSVAVVGVLDCSEKCRIKVECTAFTFDPYNSVCRRLSAVTAETPRTYYQAGRILTRAQTDAQGLAPEWHVDFPGNDIQTAQTTTHTDCCDLCNKVDNCHAYVWTKYHGGSCYLKTKKSRSDWKGANSDGSAYFIPAEVYKCQPLIQNTDLTGKDIGNAPASRAESCCAECRLVDGCTGFTWTNYNGGTCWLKSGALAQVANTGAMSGLV